MRQFQPIPHQLALPPAPSPALVNNDFPHRVLMRVKENFVPPKTWKRILPSSGRWSFKLVLESRRADPSSSPSPPSPLAGESGSGKSDIVNDNDNDNGDDDNNNNRNDDGEGAAATAAEAAQKKTQEEEEGLDRNQDEGSPRGGRGSSSSSGDRQAEEEEGDIQQEDGSTDDNNNNVDSNIPGSSDDQPPPPALSPTPKEQGIDNWPGRAVCCEVAEKFLSWEFQEGDFCAPAAERDETGDFGDSEEQREEGAATRAALVRRQVKLRTVLKEVLRNEEVGTVGASS